MASNVSNADKKEFIRWFLKHYQLKRREGVWILNYLLTSERILKNVRFTDDAHYCPRAIVMSTVDTEGLPFRFYENATMTNDPEKAFSRLKKSINEDIFIQLNFTSALLNPKYLAVLEENPYVPSTKPIRLLDKKMAENMMAQSISKHHETYLLQLIDEALDQGDKERFKQLVQQLKNLNN
jgi:uncharacterized protein YpiB (UPF0302 family)